MDLLHAFLCDAMERLSVSSLSAVKNLSGSVHAFHLDTKVILLSSFTSIVAVRLASFSCTATSAALRSCDGVWNEQKKKEHADFLFLAETFQRGAWHVVTRGGHSEKMLLLPKSSQM